MARPCGHTQDVSSLKGQLYTKGSCVMCWWYANDERYQRKWDGLPQIPEPIKLSRVQKGLPGTELKELLQELGITYSINCGCKDHAAKMDAWGVHGCKEHSKEIIGWLKEGAESKTWSEKIQVGWKAASRGIVLNPFDPYSSLVTEAITRAEKKEALHGSTD